MDNKSHIDSYIKDVLYPSSYQPLQNPLNIHFIASLQNISTNISQHEFRYCDLGCGSGVTLNLLADLFPDAEFTGIDFNPDHIREARQVASAAGLENVCYHEIAFSELNELDLGEQDYISCVGTFSWIHSTHRQNIIDFVGEKISPGGMFLVHYAAKPGKVQIDPLWHFMRVMTENLQIDSVERARKGAQMLRNLREKKADFFRLNPVAAIRERQIEKQNINYIAHEALTEWQALNHADVARSLLDKGMDFMGAAHPLDNFYKFSIPHTFLSDVTSIPDSLARETYIDYVLNRGLRWDIYIKAVSEGKGGKNKVKLGLINFVTSVPEKLKIADDREIRFNQDIARALLAILRKQPKYYEDVLADDHMSVFNVNQVINNLDALIACRIIFPVAGELHSVESDYNSKLELNSRLAEVLVEDALKNKYSCFLPAANTGHGINFSLFSLLMLKCSLQAKTGLSGVELLEIAKDFELDTRFTTQDGTKTDFSGILKSEYDKFMLNSVPFLIQVGILR